MKKLLHARYICIVVSVLAVSALVIGLLLWFSGMFTQEQPIFYKTEVYAVPNSDETLELRKWYMRQDWSISGWDFYLLTADGEEKLLKSVHAADHVAVTDVVWKEGGVKFQTRGGLAGGVTVVFP